MARRRTSNLGPTWPLVSDANDTSGNTRHLTVTGTASWEAGYQPATVTPAVDVVGVADPVVTVSGTAARR